MVLPIEKLPELAQRMHVSIGIIAVPEEAAQAVADLMVAAGITAIWNFSPRALTAPEHVVIQNEDLSSGFAVLTVKANMTKFDPTAENTGD
jgi:redox-sensing transcriptional repressor